jgi:hypothetical protein
VLAAFLEELEPARLPHCLFEGLSREAGPFAWLAAIDRLFCRGAFIVNLSYGRRANEGESGWSGLEWGTELLCRGSGGMVIAAAGQINDSMSKGDRLYLPASAPHVVACADELRAQFTSSNSEASKILLASNINPLGGRRGSSFSAPRISARAVQAYDDLPQRARNVACILAALLASARPSKTLSPGFSDSKRLSRVIARENYRCGHDESRLVLPVTSGSPLRLALSWRESEFDPVLRVLAARDQQVLRRTGQWMVMDFLPTDSRLEIKGVTGPWSLAWHPLSSEEFSRSMSGAESLEGGS